MSCMIDHGSPMEFSTCHRLDAPSIGCFERETSGGLETNAEDGSIRGGTLLEPHRCHQGGNASSKGGNAM